MADKTVMQALNANLSDVSDISCPRKPEIKHFSSQRLRAPNGMELSFVHVTPELAEYWLSKNHCNRRLRVSVADSYSRDMQAGNWQIIPSGVALLPDGSLGNAQHTLNAIIRSQTSQWLLVATNVPKQSVAAMDRGITRTLSDVGHFLDLDFESRRGSIAKICDFGVVTVKNRMSFYESWGCYERHKEAVNFALNLGPGRKDRGVNTTMLGVVARAWYTADRDRLSKFVEIVKTGVVDSTEDQAAIKYRDWALGFTSGGSVGTRETYRRSQNALRYFLARTPLQKLYATPGDIFEIPSQQ